MHSHSCPTQTLMSSINSINKAMREEVNVTKSSFPVLGTTDSISNSIKCLHGLQIFVLGRGDVVQWHLQLLIPTPNLNTMYVTVGCFQYFKSQLLIFMKKLSLKKNHWGKFIGQTTARYCNVDRKRWKSRINYLAMFAHHMQSSHVWNSRDHRRVLTYIRLQYVTIIPLLFDPGIEWRSCLRCWSPVLFRCFRNCYTYLIRV